MKKKPLEDLTPAEVIARMDEADARALDAVRGARKAIARASADAADAIAAGGRLIYVGAGTSGRLGVLDASECPPTFSAPPRQVRGVMAGGRRALWKAVEGAEDDAEAGRAEMARLKAGPRDMVMGISASGSTPYVLAALDEAAARGARTWLLRCASGKTALKGSRPPRVISLPTGREVIQGSTRLAAGTATKLALNRITTAAFVRLGKVYGELMVDVMPTNAKLKKRAAGIIMAVTGCGEDEARSLLAESGNRPKVAAVMKARGVGRKEAERILAGAGGFLRRALYGG